MYTVVWYMNRSQGRIARMVFEKFTPANKFLKTIHKSRLPAMIQDATDKDPHVKRVGNPIEVPEVYPKTVNFIVEEVKSDV